MSSPYSFIMNVPVRNDWSNVSLLVTSVQNCFNAMFASLEGSQTIATVTGELLENAIKYGEWDSANMFRLNIGGEGRTARIVVENPVRDPEAAESLVRTLAWIRAFPTPADAYRAKLLEVAKLPATDGVSGLGLVRVAYEANCRLEAQIENKIVRVIADISI